MNILVCFTETYNVEHITASELAAVCSQPEKLENFNRIINPYDEAALETAIALADEISNAGDNVSLTAVNISSIPPKCASNLLAVGFDNVYWIKTDDNNCFSPSNAVRALLPFLSTIDKPDCILTGLQSEPGENGAFPFLLAHKLSMSCVTYVKSLHYIGSSIESTSIMDDKAYIRRISVPAIYAMENADHPYLRIATLKERLAVKDKSLTTVESDDTEADSSDSCFHCYVYHNNTRECIMLDGNNSSSVAQMLWDKYIMSEF